MTISPIDLFLSFRGRISLSDWLFGIAVLAMAAPAGAYLLNNDNFDQSANAVAAAPTMAAFLWASICLYSLTALCAKRLTGMRRWLLVAFTVPALALLAGWGVGYFQAPLSPAWDSFVLWLSLVACTLALLTCLRDSTGN